MADQKRTLDTLEIIGGALCLNFANTLNSRLDTEHDYLRTYPDLTGWTARLGVLPPEQLARLGTLAAQDPHQAETALREAVDLRELLYRLFASAARQTESRREDLDAFILWWGEAVAHGQLSRRENGYTLDWSAAQDLKAPLWPVVHSAGELLLSRELAQVKECPGCGWLFLDTSKNRSRRWCSMNTCGVSDKMRRYYRKSQQVT